VFELKTLCRWFRLNYLSVLSALEVTQIITNVSDKQTQRGIKYKHLSFTSLLTGIITLIYSHLLSLLTHGAPQFLYFILFTAFRRYAGHFLCSNSFFCNLLISEKAFTIAWIYTYYFYSYCFHCCCIYSYCFYCCFKY